MSANKRRLRQSHHELQPAESNLMAEWSADFYSRIDTVVDTTKDKFVGVDLSSLKAEDYAEEIGAEVGSPLAAEVPVVEFGGASLEAAIEGEGTNRVVPIPMTVDHLHPFQRFPLRTRRLSLHR